MKKQTAKTLKNLNNKEFNFFLKSNLNRYKGEYIALVGEKVAAYGKNAQKVWQKARKKFPNSLPTLAKLPKEEALILIWKK